LGLLLGGLILGVGMSRSILQPIRSLIEAAKRVRDGDLSIPVPIQGSDEITVLAEGLEQTRLRLLESFLTIQQVNEELEAKVQERTMQVQSLLRKVIGSQEEERRRIARELHDVVLQDIAAFLMKLDVLALSERKDQGRIEKMRGLLTKAMEDIRAIIQGLRPSILDDLGLDEALRWVVDRRFQDQECEVSIEVKGYSKGQLDSNIETVTFRIAQEALTNVLKHARASRAVLRLSCSSRRLTLFVHDNGVGFAAAEYKKEVRTTVGSGIGLQGMAERASLVGGRLKIRSSPGRGSHVRLFIPLGRSVDETAD
jgi:signal transduction histidine kinase